MLIALCVPVDRPYGYINVVNTYIAEKLRASIERAGIAHINSLCADYVTVSLGVVTRFSEQAETLNDLILAADRALYRSKHEGRNRVSVERMVKIEQIYNDQDGFRTVKSF